MVVAAKERFTSLAYDSEGRVSRGLAQASKVYSDRWLVYVCPTCRTEVGFEWDDLRKHVGTSFSNLVYQDKKAIERESASRLTNENAFVDFYCEGCTAAVRAYYRYEVPERSYGLLNLKTVVERPSAGTRANWGWLNWGTAGKVHRFFASLRMTKQFCT
jgi:hypothetical protein